MKYDIKTEHLLACSLFFLTLSIQLIVFDTHPVSISVDSFGYLKSNASMRPHGYDLFLILTGTKIFDSVLFPIVVQLIMTATIPVILFFSFKQFNLYIAFLTSLIFCFYFYAFTMAPQIMSETVFIFGCTLIIFFILKYQEKQSTKTLLFLLLMILITNEVRQSVIILYPAVLLTVFCLYLKKKSYFLIKHFFSILLIAVLHINFGSFSIKLDYNDKGPVPDNTWKLPFLNAHFNIHKNSRNIAPFFMIHYMSSVKLDKWKKEGTANEKFFLDPRNGVHSKNFLKTVEFLLNDDETFYFAMASNRSRVGSQTDIREKFIHKNEQTIEELSKDIFYNTSLTAHRWPQMVQHMFNIYGYRKTGFMLRGLIKESIVANPDFLKFFLSIVYGNLLVSSFHDELFYYFVPDPNVYSDYSKTLDLFPLGSSSYASWLFQMDAVTGLDNYKLNGENGNRDWPYRNDYFYNIADFSSIFFPIKNIRNSDSFRAYTFKKNKFALPNYTYSSINRIFIISFICLIPILVFFSFFSRSGIPCIGILISGLTIILLSNLISTGPRQVSMFMIFLFPVFASGLHSLSAMFKKITSKKYTK